MRLKFYIFIYHFKRFLTNRTIFLNLVGMPVGSIMNSVAEFRGIRIRRLSSCRLQYIYLLKVIIP
jgi:ABC-type enterochelin transport system permease subunit